MDQDAYWFIAKPDGPAANSGKYASYSKVLAVQGGGNTGTFTSADASFGFLLDLGTGAISGGKLKINTPDDYAWNVEFTGQAKSSINTFGPLAVFTIVSGATSGTVSNFTFNGNMAGMFIDSGKEVVTAFSFNNSNVAGSGEHISGNLVAQQEDLDVDWGDWNQPVINNWDSQLKTDVQTLFSALQLTPDFVIKQMTGHYQYDNASGGFGEGYGSAAGALSSVTANMKVNFDAPVNQIYDGHVTAVTNTDHSWHAQFNGSFTGNNVTLSPEANTFTIGTTPVNGISNSGTTHFGGAFTGVTGSEFVGAFEMLDAADPANYVQGVFKLGKGASLSED